MGRYSIHIVLASNLKKMYHAGKGHSKHEDKKALKRNGGNPDFIYSDSTLNTYLKALKTYKQFCTSINLNPKSVDEAAASRQDYIYWLNSNGYAATTIKKNLSALSKATGTSNSDLIFPAKRKRDDIKRNRGDYSAFSQNHFSEEKNKDFVLICKSTGARRHDLVPLNKYHPGVLGTDLTFLSGKPAVCFRHGKGGKARIAEIAGTDEDVKRVVEIFRAAGSNKVFDTIPHSGYQAAPIHRYRSDYARTIYRKYARPISAVPAKQLYCCRGLRYGDTFDKRALAIVNRNLGHSGNRFSLAVNNYLYER
ncbi:MAG: site-specific integrase [Candidatus Limivicinus sp.]|jgi:hypothetical protein